MPRHAVEFFLSCHQSKQQQRYEAPRQVAPAQLCSYWLFSGTALAAPLLMKAARARRPRISIALVESDPLRFVGFRTLFEFVSGFELVYCPRTM